MTIDFPRETEIETKNEMDAVLQAGRVLMESGAEIYRIEDTMGHMAKSLGIRDFSTYVVNRGVMISGLNRSGLKESRVLATSVPSIHLGKLEEVNRLVCSSFHVLFIPVSCRLSFLVPLPLYQLIFSIIWVSGNIVA